MPGYQAITVEKNRGIGILTLNRPQVRNALNAQLMEELLHALQEMEGSEVGAVILKGAGESFCSGHDFSEFIGKTLMEYRAIFGKSVRILEAVAGMGKPVIAAVQGHATAMGCALAAGCDLAIASEDALFQTPGVNVGFACITPMAGIYRSLGRKKCLELILTGEAISAREAERAGLVNRVVPREKLEETAMEMAEKIAAKAPLAVRMGKQSFYRMADMEHSKAYAYAIEMISINASTEDGQEGMDAFREKRTPQWRGR
ncbi:enoyl-CoA hydratase-related protein [Dehalococcoidia bacterium]|nr:enoyl-CoA hydratase-related protein [Dehalococcoidia bacterium]